jgi:hypothetical protein
MYSTGHLPDHPEVVKRRKLLRLTRLGAGFLLLAGSLPMATTNRAWMAVSKGGPGILDQDGIGACEGFAHASSATRFLTSQGQSSGLLSPTALYLGALLIDQTVQPDGKLSPVTDTGTMPSSIDSAWQVFGALLAKDDPQYPASTATMYQTPSDPNSLLVLPAVEELYADNSFRYTGAYFLTTQGPARLLEALSTLAAGRDITVAIAASGPQFQNYSDGVLGALSGDIDHANFITDYEWTGSAADWAAFTTALTQNDTATIARLAPQLIFHCVNSWSEGWGEADSIAQVSGGMYRANTAFFDQAQDLSVIDLKVAA